MNIKKVGLIILLLIIIVASGFVIFKVPKVTTNTVNSNDRFNNGKKEKINVVATNFASYDFVRAIAGDNVELTFLLGPGKEAHSYEPTAQDLITIQKSDVFIYIGGEMEKWSDKVLNSLDMSKINVFCIADYVDKMEEKEVDGAEHHHEDGEEVHEEHDENEALTGFDEHIWTSPNNAIKMVDALKELLIKEDKSNERIYTRNAAKYINEIKEIQTGFKEITDNKVRNRLVFGDKMPMQYFLDEYSLEASAAFTGCSTETEPSASTIAYLVEKVKEENIPVVLYIELNTGKVANIIAEEANNNVEVMQIQTLHNVTKDDFENGETYITLMERNFDVLRKALQ